MEKIPQENFDTSEEKKENIFLNTPENSSIPIEKESLNQSITEEKLDINPGDFHKIALIKDVLKEKMVSVNVVIEIQEFAISLKEKYGPSVYDNALYSVLIGSTLEGDEVFEDFEGEDSIINFVENL